MFLSPRNLQSLAFVGTLCFEKKLGRVHFYHPPSVAGRMWNFSSVWTLHMGGFHSLSLFPSDTELKAFPCVCWQLLAPPSSWGTVSMKRPHWLSRGFRLACQLVLQANPTCLSSVFSCLLGYLFTLLLFQNAGFLVSWDPFKMWSWPWWWQNTLIELSFLILPYSLQCLGGGLRQDLLLMGCQAVHHLTSVECTHGERSCSGPRASLDPPLPFQIPSRMTFPFPVLLITPLEGIWTLECLWCFLLVMPKPLQETTGSLQPVQMGF